MSKHKRKHANRQKPQAMAGNNGDVLIFSETGPVPDHGTPTPIELAHYQLDDWIAGRIKPTPGQPFYQDNDIDHGVIWLGDLQHTMVKARRFYKAHHDILQAKKTQFQKPTAGTRPEPRTAPAAAAAVTMENERGEQVPAIPLPLFGLKKQCSCGKSFWKLRNYEAHYAHKHIVLGEQPL